LDRPYVPSCSACGLTDAQCTDVTGQYCNQSLDGVYRDGVIARRPPAEVSYVLQQ